MKKQILSLASLFAIAALALFQTACNEEHDHDHDHEHGEEHEHHDDDDKGHKDEHGHDEKEGHDDDHADEDHGHDHDKLQAGPNGGRILKSVEPHLEFFVTEDRKVQITAVDDDNKAIPVEVASVTVIGGDRSSPTRLSFAKSGDALLSDIAFPAGNDFPVVVQITPSADAKKITEKFNLNLASCPTCEYKEYACICDHAHDDHDHDEEKKK